MTRHDDPRATPVSDELAALGVEARFDHVAVAVHRIRDVLAIYRDLLGGEFFDGGDNARIGYRAIQFTYPGGGKLEILEPLRGSTFLDSFFQRGGGMHHMTFVVDDIQRAVQRLTVLGFTATGLYLEDPLWQEVFIHPREGHGALIQLAQPGPGLEEKSEGLTVEDVLAGKGPDSNGEPSP